jgi:tRNA threonylcarbamoyladenosine biosynthesis protein TsaE
MKKLVNLTRTQTRKLATDLGKKYTGKDAIIGLVGPLGAGKTAFVKDFARVYGIKKIKSPTFVIGSVYKIKSGALYHYDFYRLHNEKQLIPLGLPEIIDSRNRIILIEWVDKFHKIKKQCNLILTFEISGKSTRHVFIEAPNHK